MGWAGWQVGYLDDVSPSTVMEKSCDLGKKSTLKVNRL